MHRYLQNYFGLAYRISLDKLEMSLLVISSHLPEVSENALLGQNSTMY